MALYSVPPAVRLLTTFLPLPDGVDSKLVKNDLVRSNKNDINQSGTGVLTEVFVDQFRDEAHVGEQGLVVLIQHAAVVVEGLDVGAVLGAAGRPTCPRPPT